MAEEKTVNSQVTDAITQTALQVLGEAPSHSMAMVFQTMAHSMGLAMQNAVSVQNGMQQIQTSVVATACAKIVAAAGGGGPK